MSKIPDRDWKPTRAIKNWAQRYAEKQYQRKGNRLIKLDRNESATQNSDVETLAQTSSLRLNIESPFSLSAPVSRTQSIEILTNINHPKSEENLFLSNLFSSEKSELDITESNMEDLNAALARLSTTVEGAVGGAYKDNYRTLPPLPYFNGETPRNQGSQSREPWTLYNCQDFLKMIENAVNSDNWTEAGKLRTVQDKLTGVARLYWEDRDAEVNTFIKAKEYLLARFPNIETFQTINRQIIEFRRKPGESVSAMACRIQTLYNKLGEVAEETKASKQRNMKELFLNNLPEIMRDQIAHDDTFNKVIEKSLAYLERHKELKLRTSDIQLESTFRADAKMNNVNLASKNNEESDKKKHNNKNINNRKEIKTQQKTNSQESANVNNLNYNNNTHQRGNRGNNRRNFAGRNNQRSSFRNQYRGAYTFRGYGNSSRGQQGNFRGRYYRRENRRHYGYNPNFRRATYNFNATEPRCYSCGREGHFSRSCTNRNQNERNNNGTNYSRDPQPNYCWNCNSTTHLARNCPQRRR